MERQVNTVTRTVTVSDLTPEEMASIFAGWNDDTQAAFFHALKAETADFANSGWCGQAHWIVSKLTPEGREILQKLADHLQFLEA